MSAELTYLVYTLIFTGILWVPYVLNLISVRGLLNAVGYPDNPKPMAKWGERMRFAHYNAVENLAIFTPLVLICHMLSLSNSTTVLCCQLYFIARVIHAIGYTFAIPWVRTITFFVGVGCYLTLAFQLLALS